MSLDFAVDPNEADGVRLPLTDLDAPVTISSRTMDGRPLPVRNVFVGTIEASRIPGTVVPRQAAVPRALPPPNRGLESIEVALQAVVESAPALHLDPATADRLRALGYAR